MNREALEELAHRVEQKYPDVRVTRPPKMLSIGVGSFLTVRRDGQITSGDGRIGYEQYEIVRDVLKWAEELRDWVKTDQGWMVLA